MKNVNYNLIKSLHNTLDDVWRLEKYYVHDAEAATCTSARVMEAMLAQRKKDAAALIGAIKQRMRAGTFD